MDPIPIWVRRPWDAWVLRVLVLLSFALQVVLSIFGSRRKNISSFWINTVLVWSAYLMADWVATIALGKLSDAEGDQENNNELWFIWAPLVLLHLGGPDRITAYSLQDNQLWMRHLMGLVVQMFVAIYVIMMSWKNSWFSFMSFPAFIAGVAKYWERTWVLKSVSDDKYMQTLPVDNLGNNDSTGGCEYVDVLFLAHKHLEAFTRLFHVPGRNFEFLPPHIDINEGRINMCDAVDVKMGLMYDLLYTKATNVYSMGGCILRFITFGCTVTVLVGLSVQIAYFNLREEDDLIDIAITGVLLVGALLLEIYAAIVMFSSNWMMLWLIKHGRRDWVKWLSDRFPWLFNKKKNWSQMMGQFDLIGYWLKDPAHVPSRSGKIIRWVLGEKYEDNWNKYRHKTACSVHDNWVYDTISEFLSPSSDYSCTDRDVHDQMEGIWKILDECRDFEAGYHEKIVCLHLATEIIYHLERETDASKDPSGSDSPSRNDLDGGEDPCRSRFKFLRRSKNKDPSRSIPQKNRKVSKDLSGYMMYLLIMQPLLLPNEVLSFFSDTILNTPILISGDHTQNEKVDMKSAACLNLLGKKGAWSRIYECLKGEPRRWEIMKLLWWRILQTAAGDIKKGGILQKDGHFQRLTQGGELLTFIWFYNSPKLEIDTGRIEQKTLEV